MFCLQNVSISPCSKPIICVILLRCTTVSAAFLSLNFYEVLKFEKKNLWKFLSHSVHSGAYAPNRCILYIWYSKFHFTFQLLDKHS